MSNDERMAKPECRNPKLVGVVEFGLRISSFLRISTFELRVSFVIRHSSLSFGIQRMNRVAQFALERALPLWRQNLCPLQLTKIKAVDRSSFLSANFCGRDINIQLTQCLRNGVEQPEAVFGFDFEQRAAFGNLIIEVDAGT